MAKKVYIADLDAHTVKIEKKLDKLTNKTTAAGNKMQTSFKKVGAAMLAAFSARQVLDGIQALVNAYAEEERAIKKLDTALARNSINLQKYATQMQKITIYGDDVTMSAMSMVAAFTKDEDKIKDITKAAMELATVYGFDLETSANLVTKSIFSSTNALSRYGIEITGAQGSTERFESAIVSITEKFGGQAEAERNTYVGSLKAANNELGDLYEKLGKNITQGAGGFLSLTLPVLEIFNYHAERGNELLESLFKAFSGDMSIKQWLAQWVGMTNPLKKATDELKADRMQLEGLINKEFETEVKITEHKKKQAAEVIRMYDVMEDIYERMKEMDDEDLILGDVTPYGKLLKGGDKKEAYKPRWDDSYKHLEKAIDPMQGLVSLSNQMASNFSFAGHTFVGQLSQAIAMVDSISNMILTVASIFGGGGGFGLGGLLGLIGLKEGGSVTNRFGNISHTPIPKFAGGGSMMVPPGFNKDNYMIGVQSGERVDVTPAGQVNRQTAILSEIKNAVMAGTLASTRQKGNRVNVYIDGSKIFEVVQQNTNKTSRAGKSTGGVI